MFGPLRNSSGLDPEEFRMSLAEHLEELRRRLIVCVVVMGVAWIVAWFIHDPAYKALSDQCLRGLPKGLKYQEAFRNLPDAFFLKLTLSFYMGLLGALPVLVLQVWGFVAPGLTDRERRPLRFIAPLTVFLFGLGCYFCWLILPATFAWFGGFALDAFAGTAIIQEPGSLVKFAVGMLFAFGVGFQLPLVVYFLSAVGVVPADSLQLYWRQAVAIIFVVSAILTPSQDPFSMLMMAIPLCVLFMLSVLAVKITHRRRALSPETDDYLPE